MPFRSVVWLLPIAFTLHNVEEWIWMPGWSGGIFRSSASGTAFRFALIVLTLAGWMITLRAARSRMGAPAVYAAVALAAIMLLNVVFPHVLATLVLGRYAPGVVTAVAINTWVPPLVVRAALQDGLVTVRGMAYATVVACIVTPLSLPVLFWLGDRLASP